MTFSRNFFKTTAVCAFIGGLLVIAMWLVSFGFDMPLNIDSAISLGDNAMMMWFVTISLIIMPFSLAAFWGLTAKKLGTAAGLVTTAFIFVLVDHILEAIVYAIWLFPWQKGVQAWNAAADAATQSALKSNLLTAYYGLVDAFFIAATMFIVIAIILYTLATMRGPGIEKLVSLFFLLSLIVFILYSVAYLVPVEWLQTVVEWAMTLVFAVLYFTIGAFLWRNHALHHE